MRQKSSRSGRRYAAIPNAAMRDENISIEARGLLALLMTYADSWVFRKDHLLTVTGMGKNKFSRVMKELQEAGYVALTNHRNEKGHLIGRDWYIKDEAEVTENGVSVDTEVTENGVSVDTEVTENRSHGKPKSRISDPIRKPTDQENQLEGKNPHTPKGDLVEVTENPVSNSGPEVESEFDTIWSHYPRRVGKGNALRKYLQARKKHSFEKISAPLGQFIRLQRGTEMTKIPHLATWLHQERWEDDQTHAINRAATTDDDLDSLMGQQPTTDDQLDGLFPSSDLPVLPNGGDQK